MKALQIPSLKIFMHKLLMTDTFDLFLLEEATIRTGVEYRIDGHINAEFYDEEDEAPEYECMPWSMLRGLCFDLIKGKHTPLFFQFVLQLKPSEMRALLARDDIAAPNLKALVLNIRYDGNQATLTTGASHTSFTLDKSAEMAWDRAMVNFLCRQEIPFEEL